MPSASGSHLRVAVNGWFWRRPETGSGQYVRRLVDALAQVDPDTALSVLLPCDTAATSAATLVHPSVHFDSIPVPQTDLGKLWWEQAVVPRAARALGCTLLHVPYWAPPACTSLPTVVTIHDIIPRILPAYRGNIRVRLYTAFVSAATCRARLVLVDSQASSKDVIRHLKVKPERLRIVPLAVGPEYAPQVTVEDAQVHEDLRLPDHYLLYLGGFDTRKNLRVVLSAFAIVHRSLPETKLVIGGRLPEADTPFTPDPRRIARDIGLGRDAVLFLGFVPESHKPALYRGARAFIFPSTYEGFGYPPLEAISCGIPVVAGNTSSIPEVVGNAGVLLDPNDVEGMAGALIQLVGDDRFHRELTLCALEQRESFSWTQAATQTLAAYRAVM